MTKLLIITQTVDENDQLLGFFISWIKLFAKKFEKVSIVCLNEGKNDLPSNVKVVCLGKSKGVSKPIQLLNFYKYIIGARDEYDAVFVHMNPIWVILGGPSWHIMGKKIFLWYTHKAVTPKLRLAEKFADVIFTASKESFRLPSKKVIVTGHGIDTNLFRPSHESRTTNQEPLKILSVGRIAPVKNYETLIKASKILKDKNIDFSVTIIGEAPLEKDKAYEQKLRLLINNYQLQNYFNFLGKVINKDLPAHYQSHDIFIHLSKTGSLDKSILEAMACGMKVLSSNDSAKSFLAPDMIFDENSPSKLAEEIENIVGYPTDSRLRDYIIDNHNLSNLIEKISNIILK